LSKLFFPNPMCVEIFIFLEIFANQMDRRMSQFIYYYFSYYYQYYIWRRRLLAAIALCLASYTYLLNMQKRDKEAVTYGPMFGQRYLKRNPFKSFV